GLMSPHAPRRRCRTTSSPMPDSSSRRSTRTVRYGQNLRVHRHLRSVDAEADRHFEAAARKKHELMRDAWVANSQECCKQGQKVLASRSSDFIESASPHRLHLPLRTAPGQTVDTAPDRHVPSAGPSVMRRSVFDKAHDSVPGSEAN